MNSCCFICVFAVLINKVCLQLTVEAVIGGSVVLPCSSAEHSKIDIDVSWRHNGSKIVFDIIPHSNSPVTQDPEYKNRTETFPQEYLRGNFSIKLNHLQHTDAGQYICYITHSSKYQTVQLIINGSISTEQGETEQDRMVPSLPVLLVCIILPVLLILVVIFIVVFLKKKCSSSQRPAGNGVGSATPEVVSHSAQYEPVKVDNHDEAVVFLKKKCSSSQRPAGNGVGSATPEVVSPSAQYEPVKVDNHDEAIEKQLHLLVSSSNCKALYKVALCCAEEEGEMVPGVDATEVELYDFIADFMQGEQLQSLEDQGMARLLTLHDLVRELTATEQGFASNVEENEVTVGLVS
ncbi:uncharacterized protein [Sinocyclocheilus grahami]|uniref:uncharacterized protein n=1 Tax=Sinocyclocheilus grahami TaxID=75366 RepID=UPI0007AD2568|nr:PREDICTED: uncharacterized protein LOC107566030 [Sinocyclocheilus grahami]